MSARTPQTVIAMYRVQSAREAEFTDLLRRHYPTLKRLGLVTDDLPIIYRGQEKDGGLMIFEIFSWRSPEAPNMAHQMPEILQIWEPMGACCEDRDGRPGMLFPHVTAMDLELARA